MEQQERGTQDTASVHEHQRRERDAMSLRADDDGRAHEHGKEHGDAHRDADRERR